MIAQKCNKEIVVAAMKRNADIWDQLSEDLKGDKDIVRLAGQNGNRLADVGEAYRSDAEIVIRAVRNSGSIAAC